MPAPDEPQSYERGVCTRSLALREAVVRLLSAGASENRPERALAIRCGGARLRAVSDSEWINAYLLDIAADRWRPVGRRATHRRSPAV